MLVKAREHYISPPEKNEELEPPREFKDEYWDVDAVAAARAGLYPSGVCRALQSQVCGLPSLAGGCADFKMGYECGENLWSKCCCVVDDIDEKRALTFVIVCFYKRKCAFYRRLAGIPIPWCTQHG